MYCFIFIICVFLKNTDSSVLKNDLQQHLKDISFELISNLSDESSEGNKRSRTSEVSHESGSKLSLQSEESESNESDLSDEADSTVSTYSKEVEKRGTIDNDQVFCSWENVDARDEMATKLKPELCRFSMVCINFWQLFVRSNEKFFPVS